MERRNGGHLHRFLRWTYARWVQVIAHGDLLGRDGKPSQGKLAAITVMGIGAWLKSDVLVALSLFAAFGRSTLLEGIKSWRGVSTTARIDQRIDNRIDIRREPSPLDDERG